MRVLLAKETEKYFESIISHFSALSKKVHNPPRISIYDNEANKSVNRGRKDCTEYLGVLRAAVCKYRPGVGKIKISKNLKKIQWTILGTLAMKI